MEGDYFLINDVIDRELSSYLILVIKDIDHMPQSNTIKDRKYKNMLTRFHRKCTINPLVFLATCVLVAEYFHVTLLNKKNIFIF